MCTITAILYVDNSFLSVKISVEEYERSFEQNEELGLNDMDTSSADMAYNTTST